MKCQKFVAEKTFPIAQTLSHQHVSSRHGGPKTVLAVQLLAVAAPALPHISLTHQLMNKH